MKNRVDKSKPASPTKTKPEQIESLTFYVTETTAARIRRAALSRDQALNRFGLHALLDTAHLYETEGIWENTKTGEARYFDDYVLPAGGAKVLEREFRKEGFCKVKPGPDAPNWTDADPAEITVGAGKTSNIGESGGGIKFVPYTVMVPQHYAVFLREMDRILTDYSYAHLISVAENSINYSNWEAVEQARGWDFDTEDERLAACDAIEAACGRLKQADAILYSAEVTHE